MATESSTIIPAGARRASWGVVATLWPVAALNYLDRQVLVTMHDSVLADIPMSEARFGALFTVFLVVYGIASPIGGALADRYGRKRVILAAVVVWSLATWLTGRAQNFGELLAARALMGFGEACYLPAGLALIADRHTSRTRALATGVHMSGVYAGKVLGGLGAVYAGWLGWRGTFEALGAFGVAYAAFLYFTLRETAAPTARADDTSSHRTDILALLRDGRFVILLAVVAMAGIANWLVMGWLPKFFQDAHGLSAKDAGFHANTWINLVMFTAVLAGGAFSDALASRVSSARRLAPAIGFLIAAPGIAFGSEAGTLVFAIAGFATYGIAQGFLDANLMPALRDIAPGRLGATGYGILNFTGCLAGGLMILTAGALHDRSAGFGISFRIAAAGLVLAALLLLVPTRKPSSATT